MECNIPCAVLDEVALEGLEGITISALWLRLSLRKNFNIALDDAAKKAVWRIVCADDAIEAFSLDEPRRPLVIFNRYDHIDTELESICEPDELPEDIYPVHPVEDKVSPTRTNRGSCNTYYTRQNVTDDVKKLSLDEAVSKYGEQLVLVAIQEARSVALGGDRSDIVDGLVITSYIVLERIGRSRDLGEVTQGKHGLSRLNIPPKSAFYYRKRLLEDRFIIKQPISMRINNRNVLGTLLHLPRFYNQRLPKLLVLIKRIVEILKDAEPSHMLDYPTLKARLNTSIMLKKIFATNELKRYVKYDGKVPFRTLFPDALEKDWKLRNGDNERQIKVIQLLDPNVDPEDLFRTEDAPDDASLDGLEEEELMTGTGILNPAHHQHHRSLIRQAYMCVEASGPSGLKQKQLAEQLAVNQLDARTLLRALVRLELVDSVVKDQAKNRVYVYIASVHAQSSDLRTQFEQEQQKIQHLIESGNRLAESNRSSPNSSGTVTPVPSAEGQAASVMSTELEKDVSQMEQPAVDEEGLFRPSISRRILGEEGNTTVADLTYRSLRRANIILEAVREHQVIEEIGVLLRLISSEEAKEGYTSQMDRRSLKRLLVRLANEKQIKSIRTVLRCGDKERTLHFICQPSITMENSVIRSAIEQAKLKLFCVSKSGLTRYSFKNNQQSDPSAAGFVALPDNLKPGPSLTQSVKEAKEQLKQKKLPVKMVHNSNSGRIYGAEPKCVRVREIHGLLFYLIYGYSGINGLDQAEAKEQMKKDNASLTDETLENIPPIYQAKLGWQMFIPPLPEHCGWPNGWAFLCDILLRLPLSIFVKVVNITYFIEGLNEFLQHPVKQHLLLPHLPLELRQGLIYARKYIFSVHEVITNLVYLGLAQFGPHNLKEKDQVFIYLNRFTSVLDTTTSPPGYHQIARDRQYERKQYTFETMDDLYGYWFDVWTICSHTPLGCVNTVAGQSITLEVLRKKPAMLEACQPRQPDEAPELDKSDVPGDHLGAAGFDSAFFCHLKRNWTYNKSTVMSNRLELQIKKTGTDGGNLKFGHRQLPAPSAPGRLASLRDNASRFATYTSQSGENLPIPVSMEKNVPHTTKGQKRRKDENASGSKKPSVSWSNLDRGRRKRTTGGSTPATTTRIVKTRKNRIRRRPYYDEADRAALRLMRRLRANWTATEDSYLLMCKVAGTYLNSSLRYGMIPFFIVRDFMHEKLPESRNKTSRACQRRVNYMMRNPAMVYQVETAVEEIRHDPDVIALSGGGPLSKTERTKLGLEKLEELTIERFRKLMEFLTTRYSQSGTHSAGGILTIPDTMAEFRAAYTLSFAQATLRQRRPLQEVKNVVDIHCSVVYNVIHSSLCTVEDKASWAFQLFKIYQQYPDILLRSTLAKMKSDMMIAQKKRSLAKKPHAQLPLSACPYKLSITYIHLFLSRYQFEVFHSSHRHLKNLLRNQLLNKDKGDWNGVEVGRVHEGGSAALVTTLMAHRALRFDVHIPDQVIVFDPSIQNQPQQFGGLLERYRLLMNDVEAEAADDEHDPNGARKKRRRLGSAPAGASELPKLVSFADASGADAAEETASCNSNRVQSQLLIRTASRIALHMMREESLPPGSDKSTSSTTIPPAHLQDFFVLNACQVFAKLEQGTSHGNDWIFLDPERKKRIIGNIPATLPLARPSADEWMQLYDLKGFDQSVKRRASDILQLISSKKELGLPLSELPSAIGRVEDESCTLERHMELLLESKAVLRVGLLTARLVTMEFAHPWVVQSFKLLRQGREKLEPFNRNIDKSRKEAAAAAEAPAESAEEPGSSTRSKLTSISQDEQSEEPGPSKEVMGTPKRKRKLTTSSLDDQIEPEAAGTPSKLTETPKRRKKVTSDSPDDQPELTEEAGTSKDQPEVPRRKRKNSSNSQTHQLAKTVDSLGDEDRLDLLVMVKPWIRIDGSLNRRVLDRLLGAVLSHIQQKPGGTVLELSERFHPALQPFQVRELLEILEQMGAVELFSMKKTNKPSLFSPVAVCEIVPLDKFASESNIYCKPRVEALVRLGEFIGEKQYEKDYIPLCTCHSTTEA